MTSRRATIARLHQALDRDDIDAAVALLHPDVDWFDMLEGAPLKGREAVRGFWVRRRTTVKVDVSLVAFEDLPDDRIAIKVLIAARKPGSQGLWAEEMVTYLLRFEGDLIRHMEQRPPSNDVVRTAAAVPPG